MEVLKQIWLSADLGLSSHSGDSKNSLNQMFGISFGHLPWIGMHADARYSRFNSGFGSGSYEALSLSRNHLIRVVALLFGKSLVQEQRLSIKQD